MPKSKAGPSGACSKPYSNHPYNTRARKKLSSALHQLHQACIDNQVSEVENILMQHPDQVNVQDEDGCTALHYAKSAEVVNALLLLSRRANINVCDNNGQTPLHHASSNGHVSVVKHLCQHPDIQVGIKNKLGCTPIHDAKDVEVVNILRAKILRELNMTLEELNIEFTNFKIKYGRNYKLEEENTRKNNFIATLQFIKERNKEDKGLGITQYADRSKDELFGKIFVELKCTKLENGQFKYSLPNV